MRSNFLIFNLIVLVLAVVLAVASIIDQTADIEAETEFKWNEFKQKYQKQYQTLEEEQQRRKIFGENLKKIAEHNQLYENGEKSYTLAVNKFADWTLMEFKSFSLSNRRKINHENLPKQPTKSQSDSIQIDELPEEIDWTQKGLVSPVMEQGKHCESYWAFSSVAAIEGQLAKKTGKLVRLSEQQLVDCSRPQGNEGCDQGEPEYAYDYVIENGIDTFESYPYVGEEQQCRQDESKEKNVVTKIQNYTWLPEGDELALQQAVANVGPISVMIDGFQFEFMLYEKGVYDNTWCSKLWFDHSMAVVGYGNFNGSDYWKAKNSYGTDWGMDGYILMSRNKDNQCGIASKATYPIL